MALSKPLSAQTPRNSGYRVNRRVTDEYPLQHPVYVASDSGTYREQAPFTGNSLEGMRSAVRKLDS